MKIVSRILIVISALYLLIMPAYLMRRTSSMICNGISINIADSADYQLVSRLDIRNLVSSGGSRIIGVEAKDISLGEIEMRLARLRELRVAEAYITIDGKLNVYANQRNPVMRLIAGGGDYFVDEDGVVFRRKKLYAPRLQVVEGNIKVTSQMLSGVSVLDTAVKNTILKDVFNFVEYVRNDDFWSAQIDQISVDDDDELDLIPRLGSQRIHLGTTENYRGKLRNLETFYKEVLPVKGWNKYDLIDLEFTDQIVCRKR